jgi:hypothetical protein
MPPMLFPSIRRLQRVGGRTPLPGRRLPRQDKADQPRSREFLGLGSDVLASPSLRVQSPHYILVELAHG